jgi:virginiamycin A acetyltransferase
MRVTVREFAKALVRGAAHVAVAPIVASFMIRARLVGRDRALQSTSQWMSLIPGLAGQYLRRAFLCRALDACHKTVVIEFGTTFCRAGSRLDENAYIGVRCHLGLVHVERDVLIASGVHIPSGGTTHGIDDTTKPIREQPRQERLVRIGYGSWIGEGAVILADIGHDAVIGAGAVVTRAIPSWTVSAGIPARVLHTRGAPRIEAV